MPPSPLKMMSMIFQTPLQLAVLRKLMTVWVKRKSTPSHSASLLLLRVISDPKEFPISPQTMLLYFWVCIVRGSSLIAEALYHGRNVTALFTQCQGNEQAFLLLTYQRYCLYNLEVLFTVLSIRKYIKLVLLYIFISKHIIICVVCSLLECLMNLLPQSRRTCLGF